MFQAINMFCLIYLSENTQDILPWQKWWWSCPLYFVLLCISVSFLLQRRLSDHGFHTKQALHILFCSPHVRNAFWHLLDSISKQTAIVLTHARTHTQAGVEYMVSVCRLLLLILSAALWPWRDSADLCADTNPHTHTNYPSVFHLSFLSASF